MKKTFTLLITATLCILSIPAQTADKIINKYIYAIGGKEKLDAIKSIYKESNGSLFGMDVISKTTILNGVGYFAEIEIKGTVLSTGYTTTEGWVLNPKENSGESITISQEQFNSEKDLIFIESPFTIYREKGYKVELIGKEKVENAEAYKIIFTAPNNTSSEYYFHSETGLLIKSLKRKINGNGELEESTTVYSDYTNVDGYLVPFRLQSQSSFIKMVDKVTSVKINIPVDEAIFAKPE